MHVKDLKVIFLPTKIYTVDNKLLRGNAVFSPVKMFRLKRNNVTKVIDLRNNDRKITVMFKKFEEIYCKLFGIQYENREMYISTKSVPNQDFFDKLNQSIVNNNDGKVYVHCHYGNHRTNFVVAMYEKYLGKDNKTILNNLIANFWREDSAVDRLNSKNKKSLDVFVKKYLSA